ncbi:MAG: hypothetical protein Q8O19_08335 [Rectinemataceae bacterium]|nr:hypothetical protein [Rectinemataceae bacterium]
MLLPVEPPRSKEDARTTTEEVAARLEKYAPLPKQEIKAKIAKTKTAPSNQLDPPKQSK